MLASLLVAGVVGGLAAAAAAGGAALAWTRATARAAARLHDDAAPHAPDYDPAQLAGLPAPVARYLAFALTPGQPRLRGARLAQAGEFAGTPGRWAPFTAVEHFSAAPPGLVWDARIRVAPGLAVRVRDRYQRGEGAMLGAVAGVVPVVRRRGTPEMAAASLLRWLAESPWLPTALLPGGGVTWAPVDDATARATVVDRGVAASLDVRFGARGEIVGVSGLRHRDVRGTPVPTPWSGRFGDYRRDAGMMVPTWGEVGWDLPEGRFVYWRGRTVGAEYAWAAPAPRDGAGRGAGIPRRPVVSRRSRSAPAARAIEDPIPPR